MSGAGATSVAPADGTVLWEYAWPGAPIVQPSQTADGDVLLTTAGATGALGLRRLAVAHHHGGWTLDERWTSTRLKPYFNDFVVHDGHAIGFDGSILASIDLETGERAWKGGRYGHGQLVLLPDQDVLLVLSEDGELALVEATPDRFTELARVPALEGKTWEPPRARRRRPAGSQRPRDGRVPAVPRGRLTEVRRYAAARFVPTSALRSDPALPFVSRGRRRRSLPDKSRRIRLAIFLAAPDSCSPSFAPSARAIADARRIRGRPDRRRGCGPESAAREPVSQVICGPPNISGTRAFQRSITAAPTIGTKTRARRIIPATLSFQFRFMSVSSSHVVE